MKTLLKTFLVFTFFFPVTALAQNNPSQEIHWKENGLEYRQWIPEKLGVKLHLLKINPRLYKLLPVLAKTHGEKMLSAKTLAEKSQALALINANFFDPEGKVLGLVVEQGKILNPFHPTRWWASFLQRQTTKGIQSRIGKIFSPKQLRKGETGVQAGPRLVAQSKALKLKNKMSRKSAIGLDARGQVYLLATEGQVAMADFAQFIAAPKAQGGLGLQEALNLDGGSSTQFYLKVADKEVWLTGWSSVPVGLGVFSQ